MCRPHGRALYKAITTGIALDRAMSIGTTVCSGARLLCLASQPIGSEQPLCSPRGTHSIPQWLCQGRHDTVAT